MEYKVGYIRECVWFMQESRRQCLAFASYDEKSLWWFVYKLWLVFFLHFWADSNRDWSTQCLCSFSNKLCIRHIWIKKKTRFGSMPRPSNKIVLIIGRINIHGVVCMCAVRTWYISLEFILTDWLTVSRRSRAVANIRCWQAEADNTNTNKNQLKRNETVQILICVLLLTVYAKELLLLIRLLTINYLW